MPPISLFGNCDKSFARRHLALPGRRLVLEISSLVIDSLFGHHLGSPEISWRCSPAHSTYSPPSRFEMSQVVLTCHFARVALPNSKACISLYRGVSFVSLYIAGARTNKTNVSPFLTSTPYNCRNEFSLASSR